MDGKSSHNGFSAVDPLFLDKSPRRLSENRNRGEENPFCVRFFDHLRRIVGLFNENDRKTWPKWAFPQ
ncbi:MAG: hypothetical protein V3V31_16485 [Methylococcales bacterium]